MKIGDLVRHKTTGFTAVVLNLPSYTDYGMMTVITFEGEGKWRMSSCEVLNDA